MEVASSRPDYLPTLSAAKTSKLSLLVKHHILEIDEASYQQQLMKPLCTMIEQGDTTWPAVVPSEPSEAVKE